MLRWFFTAVYFCCFFFVTDLIFRHTIGFVADLFAIACLLISLIISVGLAEFTVNKIKANKTEY